MIKKTTKTELLFTLVAVVTLLIIGFAIVPQKPDKFENNHKYKKVDDSKNMLQETIDKVNRDYEVKNRPCINAEGVEVTCKG